MVTFEMEFIKRPGVRDVNERLLQILNVNEPKELLLSAMMGKVLYAFPRGNIKTEEKSSLGEGVIVWEVPDGVAYSEQTYYFTNSDNEGNRFNYITIDNPGTEPMELELEAKFNSDNGFLGVENEDRSVRVLFGDMAEVDKEPFERTEMLFNDHLHTDRDWTKNNGIVPPVAGNEKQQGAMGYRTESLGEGYVYPLDYGPEQSKWSGPSITKIVPPDSNGNYPKQYTVTYRMDFNTDGSGSAAQFQVGHQSLTLIDQNNKIICSVVFEDNHPTALKADNAVYVRNERVYDDRENNDYFITARPEQGNEITIEFIKDFIYVGIGAKRSAKENTYFYAFPFKENNVELRKITFYTAKWTGHPPIQNNLLRAINVKSHSVQKWRDIPNKFMDGDVLRYGKSGRNIYCTVNGFNELRLRDVGSTLITAPPGQSTIYLAYSDFSNPPEVTLTGRARYIL